MYLILLIRVKIAEVLIVLAFPNKKKVTKKKLSKAHSNRLFCFLSFIYFYFITSNCSKSFPPTSNPTRRGKGNQELAFFSFFKAVAEVQMSIICSYKDKSCIGRHRPVSKPPLFFFLLFSHLFFNPFPSSYRNVCCAFQLEIRFLQAGRNVSPKPFCSLHFFLFLFFLFFNIKSFGKRSFSDGEFFFFFFLNVLIMRK